MKLLFGILKYSFLFFLIGDCQIATPDFQIHTDGRIFILREITGGEGLSSQKKGQVARESMAELIRWFEYLDRIDIQGITEMASQKRGVYVDLKAHRSRKEFVQDLQRTDGYFQTYYFNTAELLKRSGDSDQLAIRDFIRKYSEFFIHAHVESEDWVEFRLIPEGDPDESYRLNQPVMIRESDGWKIFRLP